MSSDFDNTIIVENSAILLLRHYLLHGKHELFTKRIGRIIKLFPSPRRQRNLREYYRAVESIPLPERIAVINRARLNPRWLRAMKELRLKHRASTVDVTVISRNAADVVATWLHDHKVLLAKEHILVSRIIANNPVSDKHVEVVLERGDFSHYDHVLFGMMDEDGKRRFLDKHAIYLGDAEEAVLKGVVKEFVLV